MILIQIKAIRMRTKIKNRTLIIRLITLKFHTDRIDLQMIGTIIKTTLNHLLQRNVLI